MTSTQRDWDSERNDDLSADIWHSAWLWIVLGAAAIVAVELIDAAAGVVVLSLKFGWNDWASAFWLLRSDPVKRRGRSCFWFQLALGFWKVCAWTFVLLLIGSIVMVWIEMAPGQNAQPLPKHLIVAAMTWTISLVVATMVTLAAIASAWINRVRVWADSSIGRSRQRETWPPMVSGRNSVHQMIIGGLVVPTTIVGLGGLVTVINLLAGPNNAANGWEPIVIGVACVMAIALPAFVALAGTKRLRRRVEAAAPGQCWPELFSPASYETAAGDSPPATQYGHGSR